LEKDSIFNHEDSFQPLIKKAKKKSLRKTIMISTIVTLIILLLLFILFLGAYKHMDSSMNDYYAIKTAQDKVFGANIQHDQTATSFSLDSAVQQNRYIKNISGIPYVWYNDNTTFKIFDGATTLYSTSITSNDEKYYYRNGQRVINFYVPGKKKIADDRSFLQSLRKNNIVEVAISFTKKMTPEQMKQQFPTAQWAWVQNPKADVDITSNIVIGDYAYGFAISNQPIEKDIKEFKQSVADLAKKKEIDTHIKPLYHTMKQTNQVEVSGVVLTGTVKDLLPLIEKKNVQYVSVGVILPY
jgi:hypothetical protein